MLAGLDLLLTAVFCTADGLLLERGKDARGSVRDAELVTLAVAREVMGVDHDAGLLSVARRGLGRVFAKLPLAAWLPQAARRRGDRR
jgi:hypothetical protein